MTIQVLGESALSVFNPGAVSASAGLSGSASALLTPLAAHIEGTLAAQAQLILYPPSLTAQLADANALIASITLALTLGVPAVDARASAIATFQADILAQIGTLEAQLSLIAELQASLGAEIRAYTYSGPTQDLGSALRGATANGLGGAGPQSETYALVLATTLGPSADALEELFGYEFGAAGLVDRGAIPLGSANPVVAGVAADLALNVNGNLAGLYAQLQGAIDLAASIEVGFLAQLDFAASLVATLTAAISVGIPSVSVQLSALAQALADLQAAKAEFEAQIAFAADLSAGALTAQALGLFYNGPARELGNEVASAVSGGVQGGGPADPLDAIIIAANNPLALEAMGVLYGVTV